MGNSVVQFNKQIIIVENHENEQTAFDVIAGEVDLEEDEFGVNTIFLCVSSLLTAENIPSKKYCFEAIFDSNYWQPPQNN